MSTVPAAGPVPAPATAPRTPPRWLLFVHQLPPSPSNLRVRTWRRLQALGALPVKQAVYVLPDTPAAREDFEWLKSEIASAGGEASVFVGEALDSWSNDALVEEFRRTRQEAYVALAREVERVLTRASAAGAKRRGRTPPVARLLALFRDRLAALERIDYFGSAGRDRVVALLGQLDATTRGQGPARAPAHGGGGDRSTYTGRLWVTRPRPGVDRVSSAWLIRRFIDPAARFGFAADRDSLPTANAIPFDMFGVEFSHHGDGCTFETLCAVFGIHEPAIARIAGIVHDLDLKDGRFGAPEAPAIGTVIDGMQLTTSDDEALLERGLTLFESLYLAFAHSARAAGPRPVAGARRPTERRQPPAGARTTRRRSRR
jgi:hypothetical protein